MPYSEADLLPISALQHLLYCERQCALIHVERQWAENRATAEGNILHKRAHGGRSTTRPEGRSLRAIPLRSFELGLFGVADVVRYLVGVLEAPEAEGRVFEVGGPEVLTYLQMLRRLAVIQNRHLVVVPVPLLTPRLSSRWLALVTDVDVATGSSLVASMTNEVVVTDTAIRSVVPFEPIDYDEMVMRALIERARGLRR